MKETSECYNTGLGIREWSCEDECDPVYSQGDVIGYKNICPTCYDKRDAQFTYPCQDKFCYGDETILLRGSQVVGHYRNMAEKPEWTFPPVRCGVCRDWLRNAKQTKRTCGACGWTFIYPVGLMKRLKKTEGDPELLGPTFCPKCTRLSTEERNRQTARRRLREESEKIHRSLWQAKQPLPDRLGSVDPSTGNRVFNDLRALIAAALPSDLSLRGAALSLQANISAADIQRYKQIRLSDRETRYEHLEKHLSEFRPAESLDAALRNSAAVLACTDPARVITMLDLKTDRVVRIDLTDSRCVIAERSGDLVTQYPLGNRSGETSPGIAAGKVANKISNGDWALMLG